MDPQQALAAALSASYRIDRELSGGGMSRVFVAEEISLGRDVVIKTLSPAIAVTVSIERFRREIQVAARLQHPHIVPVLSAGDANGVLYYTMPLVEGESLRDAMAGGHALPVARALSILRDVARALEYAHGKGIVHRDIKPGNIMLTGRSATVTDFGIAKAISDARDVARDVALTETGMVVGTPAYMAPEQAAGDRDTDHRADFYALGCVAHEMLTGAQVFAGRTPQATIAAHLSEKPDLSGVRRRGLPAPLVRFLAACLEKDPALRPQSAAEVLAILDTAAPSPRRSRLAVGAVAGAGVALAALAGWSWNANRPRVAPMTAGTASQITASAELELDAAISPDGKLVAYAAGSFGSSRIFVRQLAGGTPIQLTDDSLGPRHRYPRWSPDGSRLTFVAGSDGGAIFEVPALGGAARRLFRTEQAPSPSPSWSPDGSRLAYADADAIWIRSLAGGDPVKVIDVSNPSAPVWSPDGRRIAFVSENDNYILNGNTFGSSIWVVGSDGRNATQVTDARHLNASPLWTPDGTGLLYVSNAAGTRDVYFVRLRSDGKPAGIPERLTTGLNPFTITATKTGGTLAFSVLRLRANVWTAPIDATGPTLTSAARPLTTENQSVESMSISPDGRWLAYDTDRAGNVDVFKIPSAGGAPVQITRDSSDELQPAWSPDGKRLAFISLRAGTPDIFVCDGDGSNLVRVTRGGPMWNIRPTWSPDGKTLAYVSADMNVSGLYVARVAGSGAQTAPRLLTSLHNNRPQLAWSPDGRWLATHDSGTVSLIDATTAERRVLMDDRKEGRRVGWVAWGPDPSVVFYHTEQRALHEFWSVPVSAANGRPRLLLALTDPRVATRRSEFATDGKRLFFTIASDEADVWTLELTKR